MKQLRFEYHPNPDESVIGALAEGCRDHRLVHIAAALEGGEIGITKPGLIQFVGADEATRLAHVLRTDVESITNIAFSTADGRRSIMLGNLRMPRPAFDFVRRRIGPKSLTDRPYHRSAWLNRLLPFCPESFEHLVEECATCGPLGWRKTRGIANCESCGRPVPQSVSPGLAQDLQLDYRLGADLMSRDPAIGQKAIDQLPAALQAFSRTTLVDIMLKSGIMVGDVPTRWELGELRAKPSATVAGVVAAGAKLLRSWPIGIQTVVAQRMEANVDDLSAYDQVRSEVRWIFKYAGAEGEAILRAAFPQLDGRTVQTFSTAARFYTATEVNQRLWSSSVELGKLREAGAIKFEQLPSRQRLRARYDTYDVDELQRQLQAGETPGETAARFDLPVYAIGQLITLNRVSTLNHPGVSILRGVLIEKRSAERFRESLIRHCIKLPAHIDQDADELKAQTPAGVTSLRYAMTRYGGEKPWGRVLAEMLAGKIAYYLQDGEEPETRKIMVDPRRLPSIRGDAVAKANPLGLTLVSLRDAHEILGAKHNDGEAAIAAANLTIVPYGKGKAVDREALNRLAAQVVFGGEVAARSHLNAQALHCELKRQGVERIYAGWSREALANMGLVDRLDAASFADNGSSLYA